MTEAIQTNQVKTIYRASRRGDQYTVLLNTLLQDRRMTYGTIGLLGFLLSHPEHWLVKVDKLIRTGFEGDVFRPSKREGEKAILAMIQEAKYYRYMGMFKTERNEHGQFLKTIYWVTDDPSNPPLSPQELAEYNKQNGENIHPAGAPDSPMGGAAEQSRNVSEGVMGGRPLKQPQNDNSAVFQGKLENSTNQQFGKTQSPTPPSGRRGTLLENNNINNNYYNNNLNNIAGGGLEPYGLAMEAIEAYQKVQAEAHFQKIYDMSPGRLAKLSAAIEAVGGIEVWTDHLQRAVRSKFCRGDNDDGGFVMSIDGMASMRVLENLAKEKLYIKVTDPRWKAWRDWAKTNDQKLFRIMEMVVKNNPETGVYSFASSTPPTSKTGGAA